MKLYILIGIIAVAAVSSGFGLMILTPPSYSIAIASSPTGSGFVAIDGNPVTTPCNFSWQSGSKHNITASTRASASGVQYAYSSWSDGEAQSHTITTNGTANYNATFLTVLPLTYSYVAGEQMTYNMSDYETDTSWWPLSLNETGNMTMNILNFDGQNYTIKETTELTDASTHLSINITSVTSQTYQVNQTGYWTNPNPPPAFVQTLLSWSIPGNFIIAFQKNETEAGDTWQIPLNSSSQTSNATFLFDGNLTETFSDIQNLTVPAGTYRVYSVTISGNNLTMTEKNLPQNTTTFENVTINGQEYLEYGTNRLIEMSTQMNSSWLQNGKTTEQDSSIQLELVKHVEH
jgi:hypothetical protein